MYIKLAIIFVLLFAGEALCQVGIQFTRDNLIASTPSFDNQCSSRFEKDTLIVNGVVYYKKDLKLKNPLIAFVLAFAPGFFLHGLGHIYIGRYTTAIYLSCFSILGYYGLGSAIDAARAGDDSGASTAVLIGSFALFVGSWFYDWLVAPALCERDNKAKIKKLSFNPHLRKNRFGNQMCIGLIYQF